MKRDWVGLGASQSNVNGYNASVQQWPIFMNKAGL